MKAGTLAYVNSTSTGDSPWLVRLYRDRTPLLIVEVLDGGSYAKILVEGEYRYIARWNIKTLNEN